jgi:hypothetical protein
MHRRGGLGDASLRNDIGVACAQTAYGEMGPNAQVDCAGGAGVFHTQLALLLADFVPFNEQVL